MNAKKLFFLFLFLATITFLLLLTQSGETEIESARDEIPSVKEVPVYEILEREKEEEFADIQNDYTADLPEEEPFIDEELEEEWSQEGIASWYGPGFHGRTTASGETYDMYDLTAAHKELPFGTIVEVTHLRSGRSVTARINDRGPFVKGRVIDLSKQAAEEIGLRAEGLAEVKIEVVESP